MIGWLMMINIIWKRKFGSTNSICQQFYQYVSTKLIIISYHYDNHHNHNRRTKITNRIKSFECRYNVMNDNRQQQQQQLYIYHQMIISGKQFNQQDSGIWPK